MTRKRTWTDEQLRDAVASSTSYRMVAGKLGLRDGSTRDVQARVDALGISTGHFTQNGSKGLCPDALLRATVAGATSSTEVLRLLGLEVHSNNFYKLRRRMQVLGIDSDHFARARRHSSGGRTRWSDDDLRRSVASAKTMSEVIRNLGLIPAGGNYQQVKRRVRELALDTSHFLGRGWNIDGKHVKPIARPLDEVLVPDRWCASHHLKQRLLTAGLKTAACELCGWAQRAPDGRVPIELDHVNGDNTDNRIENLRILCPNCHALQPTHRGLNKRSRRM